MESLHLRFADGRSRQVSVDLDGTVGALRTQIRTEEAAGNRTVKLIFAGRLLREQDDRQSLRDAGLHDHSFVHVVLHEPVQRPADPEGAREEPIASRFAEMGFNAEDLALIRMQLIASRLRNGGARDLDEAELRRLEEEFLSASRGPIEDPAAFQARLQEERSAEGSNLDMLFGIVLGFILGTPNAGGVPWSRRPDRGCGLIMLFWLWEVRTRKQKLGILAGIGCNVSFGLLKMILQVSA
eukprot:tig00020816_g14165.t1